MFIVTVRIISCSIVVLFLIGLNSLSYAQSSRIIEEKVGNLIAWTRIAPEMNLSQIKDSLDYAVKISIDHPYAHAIALQEHIQFILKRTGDFDGATKNLELLETLSIQAQDPRIESIYHFNKGGLYIFEDANRPKAMEEYRRSIKILEENDLEPSYSLLNNYAVAEMEVAKIRLALSFFTRAELAYRQNPKKGDEDFLTTLKMNQGVCYIHLEELDSARFFLSEAVKISRKSDMLNDDFQALVFLGVFLQETEVYNESIDFLEEAISIIDNVQGDFGDKALLFEGLSDSYQMSGQTNKAYESKKMEILYRDSLYQSGIIEKAFALDYLSEINSLKQEKEINKLSAQLKEQSFKVTIGIIVFLLGFVIAISLFINYRLNKRRQLNKMIAENERLEKERIKQQSEIKLLRSEEKLISANVELSTSKSELTEIKSRLKDHLDKSFDPEFDDLKKFVNQISSSEKKAEQLQYLDHVMLYSNNEFYKKLKRKFGKLTDDEMRLAILMRLNLSSDEIAPIFNISQASLMTKRYRLRKKLQLEKDKSLEEFIAEI